MNSRRVTGLASAVVVSTAIGVACASSQELTRRPDQAAQSRPSEKLSLQILQDSVAASSSLEPGDRAYLLSMIGQFDCGIAPKECRKWADDLYHTAFAMPVEWDRVAYEKDSLVILSETDPLRALALVSTLDDPVATPNGSLPEDVRADGATTIFQAVWSKSKSKATLAKISEAAEYIARSGQYPYRAMIPIIKDLIHRDDPEATRLLLEAVTYYQQGSKSASEDPDFVTMLDQLWPDLSVSYRKTVLTAAVSRLSREEAPPDGTSVSVRAVTSKGMASFSSEAHSLLYGLLPKLREMDAVWAEEVVTTVPDLQQANAGSGKVLALNDMTIYFDPSADSSGAQKANAESSEAADYSNAMTVAPKNPLQAQQLSQSLPAWRRLAVYIEIGSGYVQSDPNKAASMFSEAESEITNIDDENAQFHLWCTLGSAASELKGGDFSIKAISKAYSLGEELINEDLMEHPGKLVHKTKVFGDMEQLNATAFRLNEDRALASVQSIQLVTLKALLLADAAYFVSSHSA